MYGAAKLYAEWIWFIHSCRARVGMFQSSSIMPNRLKEGGGFIECVDPFTSNKFAVEGAERIYTVRKKEIRKVDGKIAPSLPGVKSAICLLLRLRIWELLSLSFLGCLSLDAQHLR